jgi:triosephosphate isomerase
MPLLFANWKMNEPPAGAFDENSPYLDDQVVVFPDFLRIERCVKAGFVTGGQFGVVPDSGSFTGDVSHPMLKDLDCSHVLCGHSERRKYHQETNDQVAAQVSSAFDADLIPVLCLGENAEERAAGKTNEVLEQQLLLIDDFNHLIIAYEPVWAIGSGASATPGDIKAAIDFIRSLVPSHEDVDVLYGGSAKSSNLQEILEIEGVDGVLVGGASLDVEEWRKMVEQGLGGRN